VIAGADGCRGGWVVAALDNDQITVERVPSIAPVASLAVVVGADIPIGLAATDRREADREARRLLGTRASTVFPTPLRCVLGAATYEEANERSRRACGRGLSKQSWYLVGKIAEVDALARAGAPLVEIHPELSFAMLAGRVLAPKQTPRGREERVAALGSWRRDAADWSAHHLTGARDNDVLDALAVLWSVERYVEGRHRTLGGELDATGLPMRIVT
jgi:predicted RNase H-like nuclease